jgi:hypothetical protein
MMYFSKRDIVGFGSSALSIDHLSQVAERGPEKAGVGGSIPSLATTLSTTYKSVSPRFHSNSFQLARRDSPRIERGLTGFVFAVVKSNAAPLPS